MTIDPAAFRGAMSQYPTGVTVVAASVGDGVSAMTVGSFTSVSLEPPLVLLCVARLARMADVLSVGRSFSVNVLRGESQALSTFFAGSWKEPKAPPHRFVPWGEVPRLEEAAVALSCRVTAVTEGGDHWVIIAEVVDLHQGLAPRDPLIFFNRRYHRMDPRSGEAAPELDSPKTPAQLFHEPW